MIFNEKGWHFNLTFPEYEVETFGGKMGELRLLDNPPPSTVGLTSFFLLPYLRNEGALACTFRGKENTDLVRYLNSIGFEFVATYRLFNCSDREFMRWDLPKDDLMVTFAQKEDYDRILEIESQVYDYSTYQIDPRFPSTITAKRNVQRVKSYFNNPLHICYVIKRGDEILGFNQFVVDANGHSADNVNSAVVPNSQSKSVGTKLYLASFGNMFREYDNITGGVCTQNIRPTKILNAMGFRFIDQEIHLRWKR